MRFKNIFFIALMALYGSFAIAQDKNVKLPPNWFNLDLAKDGYFGISTEKAYEELLKNKKPLQKVIVAVIDGGTDINHEDLKDVLWVNKKEIAGNGKDDDGNGYIDDIHGWNFIGSSKGNLTYDNLELVRIYKKLRPKYISTIKSTKLDSADAVEFKLYNKVTAEFGKKYEDASRTFAVLFEINKLIDSVAKLNNKSIPSLPDIEKYKTTDDIESQVLNIIKKGSKESGSFEKFYKEVKKGYKDYDVMLKYNLNPQYDERAEMVGDDYLNSNEKYYGNKDVKGPNAEHGTHVSGIIGATRNNGIGINGVANNVSIMSIRIVPEGDERDKDVANGIRYAVDNGAKVINMSFGKGFKWDKKVVDEAVKYAESKGVLLVHAAGNENSNNDLVDNFPNKFFESPEMEDYNKRNQPKEPIPFRGAENKMPNQNPAFKKSIDFNKSEVDSLKFKLPHASNWIEVGASAYKDNEELKASFSNFGKYSVDVFAPGFMINSTVPDSKYEEFDGTSMAAPVVSGLAALILTYYPDFTPAQVRDIIIKSAVKVNHKVKYKNENDETIRVPFSDICVSGGIANAYNALKLAETYKK